MHISKYFTPTVRIFIYGIAAAILAIATANNWVSDDFAKNVQENMPTILGSFSSILAAANVKQKPQETTVVEPAIVPSSQTVGLAQLGAIEEPVKK